MQAETGASPLEAIPIHNETAYPLTEVMTAYILRDAHEHFGPEVQAIRVQAGLERHSLNVRTREVRYAFSPQDFALEPPVPLPSEALPPALPRTARRAAEPETDLLPASEEDEADDVEEAEPLETSLESLEEGQEDEDDEDLFTMDDPTADEDDEDDEDDEEEDDSIFDPDAYGA